MLSSTLERLRRPAEGAAADSSGGTGVGSTTSSGSSTSREPHPAATESGGGWGLARLDGLRSALQSVVVQGVVGTLAGAGAGGNGRSRSDSGEAPQWGSEGGGGTPSIFSYFRQGPSGLDAALDGSGGGGGGGGGGGRRTTLSGSSPRSAEAALAAARAVSETLLNEERYADARLRERVRMQFETVLGRIVLTGVEQGKEALLREEGVEVGAVLIAVDGELLTVDSYEPLMRKVQDWTDVPEGLTGPPPGLVEAAAAAPAAEEAEAPAPAGKGDEKAAAVSTGTPQQHYHGDREVAAAGAPVAAPQSPPGGEEDEAFVDAREEEHDSPPPAPLPKPPRAAATGAEAVSLSAAEAAPSLLLTFQLANAAHTPLEGMDYQDVFPLPVGHVGGGRPKAGDDEEALAHRSVVASFKALLRAEAEAAAARARRGGSEEGAAEGEDATAQNGDDEGGMSSSSSSSVVVVDPPDRLLEHFLVCADWDLRRALEEYQGVRDEAQELRAAHEAERELESGGGGNGVADEEDGPRLVWDPATEEPPGLEEFPLFEADPAYPSAPPSRGPSPAPSPPPGEDGLEQQQQQQQQHARASGPSPLGVVNATAEFEVVITEQQRLGITVENVLERTIVCAVASASCAFRAGMEEGCLIVGLGDASTRSMCHKEVVDRLQLMHRPLRVRLRRLAPEKLQQRRAEMIALLHPHGLGAGGSSGGLLAPVGGSGGGGSGAAGAAVKEASLEARTQVVDWAEQKLLALVRLLAVGSLQLEQEQREQQASAMGVGGVVTDRPALWWERVLDVAALLQVDLKRVRARAAQGGLMGLNERIRTLAHQLQALATLFAEFAWAHPVLAPLRWPFLDLCCQLLCADADGALAVTRDARELSEGPAVVLLQEMVARLRRTQVQHNTLMLLYRLAGSPSTHARVACCALAPCLYARLPLHQQLQVRGILLRCLGEDSPPLVRAVVVEALSDLADFMDAHSLKWLFNMLELAAKDGSPRVRNKLLEICFRVAQSLHRATRAYADRPAVLQELHLSRCKLLPFVNGAAEDWDWQVRAAFAYFCPGFVETFGAHWSAVFIDNLEGLMRDAEVNVRRLACDSIPKIAEGWLLPYPAYQPPPPPLLQGPVPPPPTTAPPPPVPATPAVDAETAAASSGASTSTSTSSNGSAAVAQQSQEEAATSGGGNAGATTKPVAVARCGSWTWGEGMDPRTVSLKKQRIVDHLLPGFLRLVADPSVEVRASVAAATGRLLHLLTRRYSPEEAAMEDAALDGRIVQVMTPLMQRVLHDEAPAAVAVALLQGMRMEERVLYEGVGVAEGEGEGEDEDDDDVFGLEEEEEEMGGAAAAVAAAPQEGPDNTTGDGTQPPVPTTAAAATALKPKRENGRDYRVAPRGGSIPLPLVESQVELLLPAVALLAAHPAWRLRQAVAEALPSFQLLCLPPPGGDDGEAHAHAQAVWDLWMALLGDGVEIVRRAAGAQLCLVGRLLQRYPQHAGGRGQRWLEARVLPCVAGCAAAPAFKQRQLGLHMAEILLRERCLARPEGTREEAEALVERAILPVLLAGLHDPLANVRLVAASVLQHCGRRLPPRARDAEGTTLLRELAHLCQTDPDRDVRFFAGRAYAALGFEPPPALATQLVSASASAASVGSSSGEGDGEDEGEGLLVSSGAGESGVVVEEEGGGGGGRGEE